MGNEPGAFMAFTRGREYQELCSSPFFDYMLLIWGLGRGECLSEMGS